MGTQQILRFSTPHSARQGLPEFINLWHFPLAVALAKSNPDSHLRSNFQTHSPCCPLPFGSVNTLIWCDFFFCHIVAKFEILNVSNNLNSATVFESPFFFFFKILFIIFRERGREKERKRNINVWLPLMFPLLGTWPATQACALTGNWTGDPLVRRPALNPLSHTSQGCLAL